MSLYRICIYLSAITALTFGPATSPSSAQDKGGFEIAPPLRLTLGQCIELALENNPGLRVEKEKIAEMEYDYIITRSALFPKISLSASYVRLDDTRLGVPAGMLYEGETLAQFKARQLLFDGGRTGNSVQAAMRAKQAQQESTEAARLDTVLAVSQAYFRLLEARELLKTAEVSRSQREAFLHLNEAFKKAGRATKLEVIWAEAQLHDSERSLVQAREAVRLSELILKKVIGIWLDTKIEIADSMPDDLPEPAEEDRLWQEAIMNNPDLKRIGLLKQQADASLRSAYGAYLPEISLQGTFGRRDRDTAPHGEDEWTAGVFLEWPLFEGWQTRGQTGKARARLRQMEWNEKAVTDQVRIDLSEAVGNVRTALAAVAASKKLSAAQEEAYKAAAAFYKQGRSTYIEALTAQAELTRAKASYIRAIGEYYSAMARLNRVIGKRREGGPKE